MIRKFEVLGLMLMSACAIGVVMAPSAAAQQAFLTSDGPVTLVGTELGGTGENAITAFGSRLECPGSTYTGHAVEATPHELIKSGATEGTLTPHFNQEECFAEDASSNEFSVTVDMNGCDVVIEGGETIAEGEYGGSGELKCPEGQAVQATLFSSGSHALRVCTITGAAQGGSGSATFKNTAEGVEVSGSLTGLGGTKSGLCGSAEEGGAQLHFRAEVVGFNAEGAPTETSVSE